MSPHRTSFPEYSTRDLVSTGHVAITKLPRGQMKNPNSELWQYLIFPETGFEKSNKPKMSVLLFSNQRMETKVLRGVD
jgi:hypothetical protein